MVTVAVFTVLNIPRVVLAALEVIRIINYAECQEHGYVYNPSDITITFYNVVRLCTFINSSLNFTIYCATVRQFREDLRQKILQPLVKYFCASVVSTSPLCMSNVHLLVCLSGKHHK